MLWVIIYLFVRLQEPFRSVFNLAASGLFTRVNYSRVFVFTRPVLSFWRLVDIGIVLRQLNALGLAIVIVVVTALEKHVSLDYLFAIKLKRIGVIFNSKAGL